MAAPGHYRAIINLKTFWIIRWLDEPMPGLGWELDEQNPLPWIHGDDLPTAAALTAERATSPKTTGMLRFRGHDGQAARAQVDNTPVDDLTPLAGLAGLRDLSLAGTRVTDLSALYDLPELAELDLENTESTPIGLPHCAIPGRGSGCSADPKRWLRRAARRHAGPPPGHHSGTPLRALHIGDAPRGPAASNSAKSAGVSAPSVRLWISTRTATCDAMPLLGPSA